MRIGIFDSGIGGLTVLKAISNSFKNSDIFYVADSFYAPYGQKTTEQIQKRCEKITEFLISNHNIDALVVACNSATSVAIEKLRENHKNLIIIGIEPAIKPAINSSKTRRIGIMATQITLQGQKYKNLVEELISKSDIILYEEPCIGLVEQIESGEFNSKKTFNMLKNWLKIFKENRVDAIVLGCTHFPLVKDLIQNIMGADVELIESSKAIANRLNHLSLQKGFDIIKDVSLYIYHTGEINQELVREILKNNNIDIRKCKI